MKRISTLTGILTLLVMTSHMQAQPYIDLVQGFFHYAPPGSDFQHFNHYRFQANLPIVMKKSGDIFLINPIWEGRDIGDNPSSNIHLNGFITWITYTKQLGKGRSLTLAAIPRWNGEPGMQWSQGFQMGGAGLYSWRQSPKLEFKVGLYYNREFFGNFFMPLAGVDWTIGKKDRLFGVLPGNFVYEHRLNNTFSWGGAFRTFTNSYRLHQPYVIDPPFPPDYIRIDDNQLGIYADVYLAPKWVFNLESGVSIMRKVRTGYAYESPANTLSSSNNLYVRASFQYRLRLDRPKK